MSRIDQPQPAAVAQPRPNGERQPIAVRVVRFNAPMDAIGLSVASSCTSNDPPGKRTKHQIQYLPWLRHFRIAYIPEVGGPAQISMVPEANVKSWDPAPE